MKQSSLSIFALVLGLGMLLSSGQLLPSAVAHGNVDQSNDLGPFGGGVALSSNRQVGQEFVPASPNLPAVEILLTSVVPVTRDITVHIWDGSLNNGLPLASVTMTINHPGGGVPQFPGTFSHFDFNTPVVLTVGQTYVLEVDDPLPNFVLGWSATAVGGVGPYAAGDAINGVGNPTNDFDFVFRTLTIEDDNKPVGGELLQIENTALLLAGFQTNLAWIVPVLLAGAGFAAFKLRKRI